MSKRAASKSPEPSAPVPQKIKTCGDCHKPKVGQLATAGKIKFMSSHTNICPGKCDDARCMHKSHKRGSGKKPKVNKDDENARLLAGFQPKEHVDFKETLKRKMERAGMGSNINEPLGPAGLSLCINSIKEYGAANTTCSSLSTISNSSLGSMNSVIRYLESNGAVTLPVTSSSSSSASSSIKLQCNNCNWIFVESIKDGVVVDASCRWCPVGRLKLARAGAVMIPELFASAMAAAATTTTRVKQEPTTTTANIATHEWPRGKNCTVCNRSIAIQFCKSCLNYLCESEQCVGAVHDEAGIELNNCNPSDLIVRDFTHGTRSGRSFTPTRLDNSTSISSTHTRKPTSISKGTSSSALSRVSISSGDDSDIDMDWPDFDMEPEIVLPTCSKYRNASTQSQPTTVEVGVQTNYSMVFKPLTNIMEDIKVNSIKTEPTTQILGKHHTPLKANKIQPNKCAPAIGKENRNHY